MPPAAPAAPEREMTHDELVALVALEGLGSGVTHHLGQLIGGLRPFGHQQFLGYREEAHHPGVHLLDVVAELGNLLNGHLERGVDYKVRARDSGFYIKE